ncbi:glycosyltransferase [Collinsella tanakaei]|nr:glycosyltransferase [Collinsella tanakaei]
MDDGSSVDLRVLMISEAFGSGVYAYINQLCNTLCSEFEIYVLYSGARKETPKDCCERFDPRVRLIRFDGLSDLQSPMRIRKAIGEIRRIAKKIDPHIVHLHSSIAGALGRIALRNSGYKLVYTPHGYSFILQGECLKSRIYYLIEKVLGRIDAITLACCESEGKVALSLTKQATWIETGIDLDRFNRETAGIEIEKGLNFTVFTLGRICVQKQPALFNRIAELVPEANFVWIGDGELRKKLTADNITVTGWKPREEALSLAKKADAFILCSLGEAIAMSLLENMSLGKLVLVSNVVGNKSVIRDGVNGYVCSSAEEYAMRIRQSMRDFPTALPAAALKDIETIYNLQTMAKRFSLFYRDLVKPDK